MFIVALKPQVENLPEWVLAFLDAAWSPPKDNGQREAIRYSEEFHLIAMRFAATLEKEMAEPGAVSHLISYGFVGRGRRWRSEAEDMQLAPVTLYNEWYLEVAVRIMEAWNERATLAECVVCGSLMRPGKGRVARTCSDACRLKLHREGGKA